MSTSQIPHAFLLSVDPDLFLDLRHLDDPEPPGFNALRAGDAVRLAAENRARKSRLAAGAALSLALLVGLGATVLRTDGEAPVALRTTADPSTSAALPSGPSESGATTVPGGAPTGPGTAVAPTTAGGAPGTSPTTAAPSATTTTLRTPSPSPTTVTPIGSVAMAPPNGSRPAPAGILFTLKLNSTSMTPGRTIPGVVLFENKRSTSVTLMTGGCGLWRADLYQAGQRATGLGPMCPAIQRLVVTPGQVVETNVQVVTEAQLTAGLYGAFSVIGLEEDGFTVHSNAVAVSVVRP